MTLPATGERWSMRTGRPPGPGAHPGHGDRRRALRRSTSRPQRRGPESPGDRAAGGPGRRGPGRPYRAGHGGPDDARRDGGDRPRDLASLEHRLDRLAAVSHLWGPGTLLADLGSLQRADTPSGSTGSTPGSALCPRTWRLCPRSRMREPGSGRRRRRWWSIGPSPRSSDWSPWHRGRAGDGSVGSGHGRGEGPVRTSGLRRAMAGVRALPGHLAGLPAPCPGHHRPVGAPERRGHVRGGDPLLDQHAPGPRARSPGGRGGPGPDPGGAPGDRGETGTRRPRIGGGRVPRERPRNGGHARGGRPAGRGAGSAGMGCRPPVLRPAPLVELPGQAGRAVPRGRHALRLLPGPHGRRVPSKACTT